MNVPSLRDWSEDAINDTDNGAYGNQCIVCKLTFTGHKRRITCKICHEKDMEEARKRGDWLTAHKAPIDWIILTDSEIQEIKREIVHLTISRDNERGTRKALQQALSNIILNRGPYQADRAKEALEESKRLDEASSV